jgi:hypothetical protein
MHMVINIYTKAVSCHSQTLLQFWYHFQARSVTTKNQYNFRYNFVAGGQIVPKKCLCDRIEKTGAKNKNLSEVVSISREGRLINQYITIKK